MRQNMRRDGLLDSPEPLSSGARQALVAWPKPPPLPRVKHREWTRLSSMFPAMPASLFSIRIASCARSGRTICSPWAEAVKETTGAGGLLPQQQADRLDAAKKNVIATGVSGGLEISVADNSSGMRWFDVWIDPDTSEHGQVQGLVVTVVETTEQKRREQTLKALLREVSHRSKNLLAIIQSIASQTGHYSGSIDGFLVRFRGRLQSIAASQDLVTSSNWRGAGFRELVVGQVGRYSIDTDRTIRFSGEDPYLNPNAALHVGLAMHELAVNSVSYGALSRADGYVEVCVDTSGTRPSARSVLAASPSSVSCPPHSTDRPNCRSELTAFSIDSRCQRPILQWTEFAL